MASILYDYEYDIFISYRQNDNKYDGWVTEFVDNLQKELDATLKNPVSIYFDENPHDGLQDTHVVGESLKKKLKCLILIPIISQTYCDENSFAWQHEFLAFKELASDDELGMNITLTNGNIASRILPIRIHDIDPDDQQKFENATGSPLRAIDFIYKEAGVNRSLKPEDDKKDNLNSTSHRNQMNKVAHAIKDLGIAIRTNNEGKEIQPRKGANLIPQSNSSISIKSLFIGILGILLMMIGYWGYTKFSHSYNSKNQIPEPLDKTIAVLPFSNTKPDTDTDFLGFAVANQIIGDLDYNKNVIVRPASSVRKYDKQIFDRDIVANDLKVNYVLTGTYLMQDDIIRLNIELVEANSENTIWREKIEVNYNSAFELQDIVAKKVVDGLNAEFSQTELSRINKNIPSDPLAYEYYLRGISYPYSSEGTQLAIKMLSQSIKLDSSFAPAYTELGSRYNESLWKKFDSVVYTKVEKLHLKAISINDNLISARAKLSIFYTKSAQIEKALDITRQILEINPNHPPSLFSLGYIYRYSGMNAEAVKVMEKAFAIDPENQGFQSLSMSYFNHGEYEKAFHFLDIIEKSTWAIGIRGLFLFRLGKEEEAIEYFNQIIKKSPEHFMSLLAASEKAIIENDTLKASELLKKREQVNFIDGEPLYYLATDYAKFGNKNGCNRILQKVIDAGYFNYPLMVNDPFLKSMHNDSDFQIILSQAKAKHEAFKKKYF